MNLNQFNKNDVILLMDRNNRRTVVWGITKTGIYVKDKTCHYPYFIPVQELTDVKIMKKNKKRT